MKDYQITLKTCEFFGYHGVLEAEKEQGQPFIVDAVLSISANQGIAEDDISATVDYGKVFQCIERIVTKERFDLIETLASVIASEVRKQFPLVKCAQITVKKPHAPINGTFEYVSVTVADDE